MNTQTSKPSVKQTPVISMGGRTQETKVTRTTAQSKQPLLDDIYVGGAARAYELYVERRYRVGSALEDWRDAEQEILSRTLSL